MSKTKWTPKAATPEALAALAERCKGRTGVFRGFALAFAPVDVESQPWGGPDGR